jgi:outer membrane protein TolC
MIVSVRPWLGAALAALLVALHADVAAADETGSDAARAAGGATTDERAPIAKALPAAEDPELTPPPRPSKLLRSWDHAKQRIALADLDYRLAQLEVERARGAERQTLAQSLPTLTATTALTLQLVRAEGVQFNAAAGGVENTLVPPSPVGTAAFVLRQPVFAPRAWYANTTATLTTDAADLSASERRRLAYAAAANAAVSVVAAERIAELNRVGLGAALQRLALQRRRLELGQGTALDVIRFEQDVVAARSTIVGGDEDLRRARERLGLALGDAEAWSVDPSVTVEGLSASLRATCKVTPIDERRDLAALQTQLQVAERGITDVDLQFVPTAEISSTFSLSTQPLATTKSYAWSVVGQLSWNLWDGGARYGSRRVAEVQRDQVAERLVVARRAAQIEVTQTERAVVVARQTLEVAQRTLELAAETDRLAQRAFDGGAGTSFDLVDAQRRLREAKLQVALRELELVRTGISAQLASSTCPD